MLVRSLERLNLPSLESFRTWSQLCWCLWRDQGMLDLAKIAQATCGYAELRVQDEQYLGQATRICFWFHLCSSRCLLCISICRSSKRQNWPRSTREVLCRRKDAWRRRWHLHSKHVPRRGSYSVFELVSKRNCHWILQYVKSATGETDVPDTMAELILQRRDG